MKKKKTILVTGAASGIGLAIVNHLAEKGDHVIAVDNDENALSKLRDRRNIETILLDITDNESIRKVANELEVRLDGLDGLVNNAGIFLGGPLVEVTEEELFRIINVNVLGTARVTRAFFPLLHKKKGRIVVISSEVARFVAPFNGPYTMTKFAIEAFSDSLRRELMFENMKVSIIQPGAINSNLLDKTPSKYTKYLENSLFRKPIRRIYELSDKETKRGVNPILVAKKVYRALHRARPKRRYRVRNDKGRVFIGFLPPVISDFLIKLILK